MSTLSITTNTSSLTVQRNLREANDRSASSLAKLSSGSRVPTARDDAASLAIGSRMEAEVAGLNQASINASQATSMLQIADGALSEVNDVLVRLKSLSVQSSSGQLSDAERGLLDSEFQQLLSEIDRITTDTEFNGNTLLNGGDITTSTNEALNGALSGAGMKVSYNANVVSGAQDSNGDGTLDIKGDIFDVEYDSATEIMTLTNRNTGEVTQKDITDDLNKIAGAGSNLTPGKTHDVEFTDMGVKITLNGDFDRTADFNDQTSVTASGTNTPTYTNLTASKGTSGINSDVLTQLLSSTGAYDAATGNLQLSVVDNGSNSVTFGGAGLEFSVDGGSFGAGPTADLDDGAAHTVSVRLAGSSATLFTLDASTITSNGSSASTTTLDIPMNNVFGVQETEQSTSTFDFQVGTGTSAEDTITVQVEGATTTSLGLSGVNVRTQDDARNAIDKVGESIDNLQKIRAQVGSSLSRLDFASSNLAVSIENSESAKAGLLDVDVAAETTRYAAEQVVVQAGVSLLAQANQRPETLLQLLQG